MKCNKIEFDNYLGPFHNTHTYTQVQPRKTAIPRISKIWLAGTATGNEAFHILYPLGHFVIRRNGNSIIADQLLQCALM